MEIARQNERLDVHWTFERRRDAVADPARPDRGDDAGGMARGSRAPIVAVSAKAEGNAELVRAGADAVCGKMDFARIAAVLARVA